MSEDHIYWGEQLAKAVTNAELSTCIAEKAFWNLIAQFWFEKLYHLL